MCWFYKNYLSTCEGFCIKTILKDKELKYIKLKEQCKMLENF